MYAGLRGDEFEAIAKKSQQTDKSPKKKESTKSRPRTSWIPYSSSVCALDYADFRDPIIEPRTTTFSRSPKKCSYKSPEPHDERFGFNPRAVKKDLLDATRFKPFPIVSFKRQLPRDNKPFVVTMTPVTRVCDPDNVQTSIILAIFCLGLKKVGIPFSKMMPRSSDGCLAGQGLRRSGSACSYHSMTIEGLKKNMDKLSTCKRIIAPKFERFKSRYREGQSMPSFMENVNNRTSINSLCFEMLKANNYFATDMGSQISSCSPKKSFNKKTFSPTASPSFKSYAPNGNL
jgi:hypothetical protein